MNTVQKFQIAANVAVVLALLINASQLWFIRRSLQNQQDQLKTNSKEMVAKNIFQIWQTHVQTNHLSIATGSDEIACELNKMSPYAHLAIGDARKAHFADAVFDMYECISLLSYLEVVEPEVARVWRESVNYELSNSNLVKHWKEYHAESADVREKTSRMSDVYIYHDSFRKSVDAEIARRKAANQKFSAA